jgi:hypothetical protein
MTWRNHLTPDEAKKVQCLEEVERYLIGAARYYAGQVKVYRERCSKRAQRARGKTND